MKIARFGERASLVELDDLASRVDRVAAAIAMAGHLRAAFPGADVVAGAASVLVDGLLPEIVAPAAAHAPPRVANAGVLHEIAVRYDGEDLDDVARATSLSRAEIVRAHTAAAYRVEVLGFLPGFGYLGELDPALVLPRRASPRPRVPARAVAIAGVHAGVYPFASSGGWHLLGRATTFLPFDPAREPAVAWSVGDRVRFVETDAPFEAFEPAPGAIAATGLEVVLAPAAATVQDAGRRGALARGLPPSGPLDEEAHAAANHAVGNAPGAAAIEVPLGALEVRARGGRLRVAVDGAAAREVADGDRLRIEPEGRAVRYLAVAGGLDVPVVMGARATLLVAGVGRALRRGDVLPIGSAADAPRSRPAPPPDDGRPLAVLPGPHLHRFPEGAFEQLLASPFAVSRLGDRVGLRLDGPKIRRAGGDLAGPTPMIRGAIQITTDGTPIVLGPDHPTTGGYPVLAVLTRASASRLARRLPGAEVRFSPA